MSAPVVELRGVHAVLGGVPVLRGIDLTVAPGEVVAVLGPSGGGKSTLLRTLNHLVPLAAGEARVAGYVLRPGLCEWRDAALLRGLRRRVGMVFQDLHLFPHLTVLGNVTVAPRAVLGLPEDVARQAGLELLARVGLERHAGAYPGTLSGGQQQRVAIARALAMRPAVLLCDEPTSALDPALVREVQAVLGELAAGGQTMLVVTHHLAFARRVADRAVVLADGRIEEEGPTTDVLSRPASAAARALVQAADA